MLDHFHHKKHHIFIKWWKNYHKPLEYQNLKLVFQKLIFQMLLHAVDRKSVV